MRRSERDRGGTNPWRWWVAALGMGMTWGLARSQDLADVLPALKGLPAPSSVTVGLRLSYDVAVATVQETYAFEWLDYAGTADPQETPRPSGHGCTQVDVVGLTDRWCALRVQPWTYSNFTGPLVPLFGSDESLIGHAGGGDWYVHPSVLAGVEPVSLPELKILRMPARIGPRTVEVLRIQTQSGKGRLVTCYDLATGYLLYKAAAVAGGEGVNLSQATLTGSRMVTVPWGGAGLPGWVTSGVTLRYQGTYTATAWGAQPFTVPLEANLSISARDADWFVYDQTTTMGSLPGMPPTTATKTLATGMRQLGGLTLPAPVPGALEVGQRLDMDEVTGATVEVAFRGWLPDGREGLTLRTVAGTAAWSEATYDLATGVALRLRTYEGASPLYTIETEMRLEEVPAVPPRAPRLAFAYRAVEDELTLTWMGEGNRAFSLLTSVDGGRSWGIVSGWEDRASTGETMEYRLVGPRGTALFRVRVR